MGLIQGLGNRCVDKAVARLARIAKLLPVHEPVQWSEEASIRQILLR